ncbi:MAG: hypothetical protein WCA35_00040 [Kovacikia sp.]
MSSSPGGSTNARDVLVGDKTTPVDIGKGDGTKLKFELPLSTVTVGPGPGGNGDNGGNVAAGAAGAAVKKPPLEAEGHSRKTNRPTLDKLW